MTRLDHRIQRWRIRRTRPFIPSAARVLDIGCADGTLFRVLPFLRDGVGVDPDLQSNMRLENATLISGYFPRDLPDQRGFDVITMLAVLEHIPHNEQISIAKGCFQYLKPGGRLIITVPSPMVDNVLAVLKLLRLVDGMRMEQHYGFDVSLTPEIFGSAGFELLHAERFQLGLNNLFVFGVPALTARA